MYKLLILLFISPLVWGQRPLFATQGQQPDFYVSKSGKIELVFGQKNKLYYSFSIDQGKHFSDPILVDSLEGLHLGASRGPRIASANTTTIISAINKQGNVYAYRKEENGKWNRTQINDIPEVAKEGFNAIATNQNQQFVVIWLDLRGNKRNKLMSSFSQDGGKTWNKNQLIYASPDSTICECCQPNVIMQDKHLAIMFRNWLEGSRDMYVIESKDGGQHFQPAQKLGKGTWPLNACPMDGGSISFSQEGKINTVWRRAENLFTSGTEGEEVLLGPGKNASITSIDSGNWLTWHHQGLVWLKDIHSGVLSSLGAGRYPIVKKLNQQSAFMIWENQGGIFGKTL